MTKNEHIEEIKRLKAIAEVGLLYCKNDYDKQRYTELQEISYKLLSGISVHDINTLKASFPAAVDYPTAKVDIRGLALSGEKEVLLVRESIDGKWSLPGGWAEFVAAQKRQLSKSSKRKQDLTLQRKPCWQSLINGFIPILRNLFTCINWFFIVSQRHLN